MQKQRTSPDMQASPAAELMLLQNLDFSHADETNLACRVMSEHTSSEQLGLQRVFLKGVCQHADIQLAIMQMQAHPLCAAEDERYHQLVLHRMAQLQGMLWGYTESCSSLCLFGSYQNQGSAAMLVASSFEWAPVLSALGFKSTITRCYTQ